MAIIDSPTEQRSGHPKDQEHIAAATDDGAEPAPLEAATAEAATAEAASETHDGEPHPLHATSRMTRGRQQPAFLAELARAMHASADSQRSVVLERARLDAEAFVEGVRARSAEKAAEIKRVADADVSGIREWSKAEIARVRDETERRIAERRSTLDQELEEHAAGVAAQVALVETTAQAFEAEMAAFFERLLEEDDAARFAALAANLPEPPSFEDVIESAVTTEAAGDELASGRPMPDVTVSVEVEADGAAPDPILGVARSAQTEGLDTAAEIAESDETADGGARPEVPPVSEPADEHVEHSLAEAEASAAAAAVDEDVEDPAPESQERATGAAWAARLAGLIGHGQGTAGDGRDQQGAPEATEATQVVVVGLVSVASIAGFKRQLAHLPTVAGVTVSSGPDGEFVFRVAHGGDLALREAIPTLPGYQSRVISYAPGIVHVSARDPESEA